MCTHNAPARPPQGIDSGGLQCPSLGAMIVLRRPQTTVWGLLGCGGGGDVAGAQHGSTMLCCRTTTPTGSRWWGTSGGSSWTVRARAVRNSEGFFVVCLPFLCCFGVSFLCCTPPLGGHPHRDPYRSDHASRADPSASMVRPDAQRRARITPPPLLARDALCVYTYNIHLYAYMHTCISTYMYPCIHAYTRHTT